MRPRYTAPMAVLAAIIGIATVFHPQAEVNARSETSFGIHCGSERWSAKTLADGTYLSTSIIATSVEALRPLPRPAGVDGFDSPRARSEQQVYRVQAELLGFKLENDQDIHLVLAQPGNRSATIIAEIPDPKCMRGAGQDAIDAVGRVRLAFVRAFGIPPVTHFAIAYKPVTVIGPAFFDFDHEQSGLAPNAIEIHPVIGIETQ